MHRLVGRIPIVIAGVAAAVLAAHAQRPGIFISDAGLPAVDVGLSMDARRAPGTPETRAAAAIRAALRSGRDDARTAPISRGRVLVKFRADASAPARAAAVRAASQSAVMLTRQPYADFDLVRINEAEDPETVAAALRERHADVVVNAQAAYQWHTMLTPNDELYRSHQWNLPYLNLEKAWDIQPGAGSDIIVAVIDTGVAYRHATITAHLPEFEVGSLIYPSLGTVTIPYSAADQLVDAARQDRIVAPYDFIWDNNSPLDFDGHGTHVSGTIGQITNDSRGTAGVAFNVRLMPVKVIDGVWDILFGAPNTATDDLVARGIRYAADHGAKVLNMSIGRSGPPSFVVEDAIRYAVSTGAFVAAAVGNEFEEGNPISVIAEICSRVNGAVSVAAIDRNRAHAFYSNSGSYVEVAAPGGSNRGFAGIDGFIVQQTFDFNFTDTFVLPPSLFRAPRFDVLGYVGYIGTSMATPHVAGAAAILMQQGITSPAAIEDALRRTADDLGTPGPDEFFGYGLVNVRNAMFGIGAAR